MVQLEKNTTQIELFRYRRWPFMNSNSYGILDITNKGDTKHYGTTHSSDSRQLQPIYGYYYIERQLWYVPLYFSVYFVFYIGALVIKALSRHRVYFPQTIAAAVTPVVKVLEKVINNYGQTVQKSVLQQTANKYGQSFQPYNLNQVPNYQQPMKHFQVPEMQNYQLNQVHNYG